MSAIQQILTAGGVGTQTLFQVIQTAGLTANLQLCLDAGDPASYTSGQSWLDRSGNGYDFFLGATSGAEASDPTLTGTAGVRDSYWAFDGGDFFRYDTTNETWMQNIHKDNAVFTILSLYYRSTSASADMSTGTSGSGALATGFMFGNNGAIQYLLVQNAGANVLTVTGDTSISEDAYHMIAVSLTEATGAGGGFYYLDGAYNQVSASDTFTSTYSSPSAGSASFTMEVAACGSGGNPFESGDRLSAVAVWSSALTKAQLDVIWALIRGRFNL